jgi:hypothetical protein
MIEETAMQGGCPARAGNVPLPLDRSLPRTASYEEGVAVTHVQASASARRSACCAFLSFLVRALQPELACLYGDGLGSLGDAHVQCTGGRVPGEGDLVLAQVPDHLTWAYRARYAGSGSGPAAGPRGGW